MKLLSSLLFLSTTVFSQSLTPSSTAPGTKEEAGIVTTLALQYTQIRSTVRDMYMSIQYGKAMIQTVEDQRAWFRRNIQGWKDVGHRIVRIVDDPARWDKKLMALEDVFDKTDVLLFEEPRRFDELMYKQERAVRGIGLLTAGATNNAMLRDFFDYNGTLYREGDAHIPNFHGTDAETNAWLKERERQRLLDAKTAITGQQSGRVRDATVLAASVAQAQLAALKALQRKRSLAYEANYTILNKTSNSNTKEMAAAFNGLKSLDGELDQLVLRNIELQITWAQLGTQAYDLTSTRSTEIQTAESMDDLGKTLSP